jgi:hypothetical protein
VTGGHREIQISDWKPHNKGTLVGFFSATLPSGLVLHGLMLHRQGEARWIGYPAREYVDQFGTKQYARIIEFTDRATADRFRDAVLDALDQYLAGGAS